MKTAKARTIVQNASLALAVLLAPTTHAVGETTTRVHLLRAPNDGIQPQAVVDTQGLVHLIYFKGDPKGGDIFYVYREPGGQSFSQSLRVNSQPHTAMAIGTIRGAQFAVGKNSRVHVVWNGMGEGIATVGSQFKNKNPLFYTRLNAAGNAFEPERDIITFAHGLDGGSSVAADSLGHVYVTWHAPLPGNTNGEAGRAVFISRSADEGQTFARETPAVSKPTGACGCCGMRAFADKSGAVYVLFRAAGEKVNRNETLLISHDLGATFEIGYDHGWKISTCPMSSACLTETPSSILAAAETHNRVFYVRVDQRTGGSSTPVSPETQGKHPVAVANHKGETLLVWAEGTGWNQGGSVVWQLFSQKDEPISAKSHSDGLKVWSLPTAFAEPDGNFVIVY